MSREMLLYVLRSMVVGDKDGERYRYFCTENFFTLLETFFDFSATLVDISLQKEL